MENVPRGWQATTRKVRLRLKHVFESMVDFPADVHFKVGRHGEATERIGAHKMILAAGSDVFYAMMYGPMAEKRSSVPVTELHPDAFREMLRFLYTDRLSIEGKSQNILLLFGTMECGRKYDVPELFFACRLVLVKLIRSHGLTGNSADDIICTTVFIEALAMDDQGLAEACCYKMYRSMCCPLSKLDVGSLSHDILCRILSRKDDIWSEKELYDLAYRWAFHCGEATGPVEIREKLDAARYLIRYSLMSPTDISDGPAETEVLTSTETKMVFKQKFSAMKDTKCPFGNEVRPPFQYPEGKPLYMPIAICNADDQEEETISLYYVAIANHPQSTISLAKKFRGLITSRNPFALCVNELSFDVDPDRAVHKDERSLLSEEDVGAAYLMEGDIAISYDTVKDRPLVHVATRSGFTPTGWLVAGRVSQQDLELLRITAELKIVDSSLMAYHKPFDGNANIESGLVFEDRNFFSCPRTGRAARSETEACITTCTTTICYPSSVITRRCKTEKWKVDSDSRIHFYGSTMRVPAHRSKHETNIFSRVRGIRSAY